jgi:uncharacterized membrane protein YagU involved in acid resistance
MNMTVAKPSAALAIFWGGLIVGVGDITYAFVFYGARGVPPGRLLQGIASGLVGPSAFVGGLKTAAFGLFLHFVISYGAATTYYLASRKLHFMVRHAVRSGLLYGVAVYLFMNFIVIPLSLIGRRPFHSTLFVVNMIQHMVMIGLPIALSVRRFSGDRSRSAAVEPFPEAGSRAARA